MFASFDIFPECMWPIAQDVVLSDHVQPPAWEYPVLWNDRISTVLDILSMLQTSLIVFEIMFICLPNRVSVVGFESQTSYDECSDLSFHVLDKWAQVDVWEDFSSGPGWPICQIPESLELGILFKHGARLA